jgi:hypothetical protein
VPKSLGFQVRETGGEGMWKERRGREGREGEREGGRKRGGGETERERERKRELGERFFSWIL